MQPLKAFFLGALALGVLAYALAASLALTATERDWKTLRIGVGPLVLVAVERIDGATVTTFGAGIAVVALAGGIVNATAALAIMRWRGARSDSVD
jgi:hypothetical protein